MSDLPDSYELHCHMDPIFPIYKWLQDLYIANKNVKVYKRKNFVFFNPEYKIRHQAEYSIIVATEEGDAYPDTKKAILQYIKKFNPQTKKLFFVGYEQDNYKHKKIININLKYPLHSFFYNHTPLKKLDFSLTIKKPGSTLINRIDPSRLKTFCCFIKNNLDMYISVNSLSHSRTPKDVMKFLKEQCFDKKSPHFEDIDLLEIAKKIPFQNFKERKVQSTLIERRSYFRNKFFMPMPKVIAKHSLFFLVMETYPDHLYFTEKTLIPLYIKKIFLTNTPTGIDLLKGMGFDVFDDIVDHSYQYIKNTFERQDALLNQFARLLKIFPSLNIKKIEERLNANQEHLINGLNMNFVNEQKLVFEKIKTAIPNHV